MTIREIYYSGILDCLTMIRSGLLKGLSVEESLEAVDTIAKKEQLTK